MLEDLERVLIDETQIRRRVGELAREIAARYRSEQGGLTIVPIMSGSIIFLADLIREIPLKLKISLAHLSSYREGTQSGTLEPLVTPVKDITGRHVLIVDDILDTGRTLRFIQGLIRGLEPTSLRTAVLLRKPAKAPPEIRVDFVAFDIDDLFVVGYGLDYADVYRNYPHIGVLKRELMP